MIKSETKNLLFAIVLILLFSKCFTLFANKTFASKDEVIVNTIDSSNTITKNKTKSIEKLNKDSLKKYIKRINIKHPDIVYAQAVLESSHFTSDLYYKNNNLFGMKAAKQRPYTYVGVKNGYADYTNWKQSVLDYALFQSSYMRRLNRDQYFDYLQRNYAKDTRYVLKLKAIINNDNTEWRNLN